MSLFGLASTIAAKAFGFSGIVHPGRPRGITDFDVFHIVARLALSGRIADVYSYATLKPLEQALATSNAFATGPSGILGKVWSRRPRCRVGLGASPMAGPA